MATVIAGLDRTMVGPVGRTWIEPKVGYVPAAGLFGRLEAGHKLNPWLGVFGFGEYSQRGGPGVGLGARFEF